MKFTKDTYINDCSESITIEGDYKEVIEVIRILRDDKSVIKKIEKFEESMQKLSEIVKDSI